MIKNIKENKKQNLEKIKQAISETLQIELESIHDSDKIKDDLGADSIDVVDLYMKLENEFNIVISDEIVEKKDNITVLEMYDIVEKLIV